MVTENGNETKQVVNDTQSTKLKTTILDNEHNNRSSVEIAKRCRQTKKSGYGYHNHISMTRLTIAILDRDSSHFSLFTVSTVNYQCERLLKEHYITAGYQDRKTTILPSLFPSPQLKTMNISRK